jgi:hypothetical protein
MPRKRITLCLESLEDRQALSTVSVMPTGILSSAPALSGPIRDHKRALAPRLVRDLTDSTGSVSAAHVLDAHQAGLFGSGLPVV